MMAPPDDSVGASKAKTWPWMPVFLNDWLAIRLLPEQKGALMDLRAFAWSQDPPCSLPDDEQQLSVISGLHDRWATLGPTIRAMYLIPHPLVAGRLLDRLLYERYVAQVELSAKRSTVGKTGGIASAKTRASGKQSGRQPTGVAAVVASVLPDRLPASVWSLDSQTAVKAQTINDLEQIGSNGEANYDQPESLTLRQTMEIRDAERAEYDAKLRDFCIRWGDKYPAERAEIELAARKAEGFTDADLSGDGMATRLKRAAIEQRAFDMIRQHCKKPTLDEWLAGKSTTGGDDAHGSRG